MCECLCAVRVSMHVGVCVRVWVRERACKCVYACVSVYRVQKRMCKCMGCIIKYLYD